MYRIIVLVGIIVISCGCANDSSSPPDAVPSAPAATSQTSPAPSAEPAETPTPHHANVEADETQSTSSQATATPPRDYRVVHVIVALADNEHQGIVRVPADLGNGQNPRTNLYWGAMYGTKTFLQRSEHWRLLETKYHNGDGRREICIFKHRTASPRLYLIAEAYDGRCMKEALLDFFQVASGMRPLNVPITGRDQSIAYGSGADLVCFIGHNGLMDIDIDDVVPHRVHGAHPKQAVVLACRSGPYFSGKLAAVECEPLVMTTGLMAPEAYTLDALVEAWQGGGDVTAIRRAAADAYAKYQRCSVRAARRLFDVE